MSGKFAKKPAILIAINVRWWNAEAAYALNLAEALRQQGHWVIILANPHTPAFYRAQSLSFELAVGVRLDTYNPWVIYKNYYQLKKIIQTRSIQYIFSFKTRGAYLFSFLYQQKIIVQGKAMQFFRIRGEARPPKNNAVSRWFYGTTCCTAVVTASDKIKHWLEQMPLTGQKINTIAYATQGLKPNSNRSAMRQQLGYKDNQLVYCLLGRMQAVKGHVVLLKAFASLVHQPIEPAQKKSLVSPAVQLLFLVKDLQEYPQQLELCKKTIQSLNIGKHVQILGHQKKLADCLQAVDVGVIPSLASEVQCRVAVEFFSLSIPVVAFPTGSLPEVVQHKQNGYVCPTCTAESLKEGLTWVRQQNLKKLRLNALQTFEQNYTLNHLYKKFTKTCGFEL